MGRKVSVQSHLNTLASLGVPHSPVFIQTPKLQYLSAANHVAGPRAAAAHARLTKLQPKGFQHWHHRGCVAHIATSFYQQAIPTPLPSPRRQNQLTQVISFPLQQTSSSPHSHTETNTCQRLQGPPCAGSCSSPGTWHPRILSPRTAAPLLSHVSLCQLLAPRSNLRATPGGTGEGSWGHGADGTQRFLWGRIPAAALACVHWRDGWCSL